MWSCEESDKKNPQKYVVVVTFRISHSLLCVHARWKRELKSNLFDSETEATANKQNVKVMVDADRALLNSRDPITFCCYFFTKFSRFSPLKKIHKTLSEVWISTRSDIFFINSHQIHDMRFNTFWDQDYKERRHA